MMEGRMKVLVFASSAFPRWPNDPSPAFVYNLSKHLQQKGVEVVAVVPHHPGSKRFETVSGIRTYRFRYFLPSSLERLCYDAGILPNMKKSFLARLQLPIFVAAEFFSLWKVAKKEKPDIIHAHWILPQGFTAAIVSKILRIPVVVTAHAGDVFPLTNFLLRLLSRFSTCSAAAVTVNSSYTKLAVAKISKLRNIKVIPMGVDLRLFSSASSPAAAAVRKKYGISKNGKVLLFVGRLAEKKGVKYLISAMKRVLRSYPQCKLVAVGEGHERSSLMRQSQQLGLSDNIIFAGSIPNTDLPSFYKAAD
ncbi:MAG: glycosyltransferase, partial [Nanoarchaeota archaeon]